MCLGHETGSIEVGKKADMLFLDRDTVAFTPRNDIANHLVYCETGSSITHAIVSGEVMAENGRCLRVNETELLAERREEMPAFLAAHEATETANSAFVAAFRQIHRKANARRWRAAARAGTCLDDRRTGMTVRMDELTWPEIDALTRAAPRSCSCPPGRSNSTG